MAYRSPQRTNREMWALVRRQHGVVSRAQLLDFGLSPQAVLHRVATGRLHRVRRGVYAVGRPDLSRYGMWMAAVLACGPSAVLSHRSAAQLWGIIGYRPGVIEISIPAPRERRGHGIVTHRRANLREADVTKHHGVPTTTPVATLIDLASCEEPGRLEAAISEADKLGLVDPELLRAALDEAPRRPGIAIARKILDGRTFALTDSELERRFLPLACDAGLPPPRTRTRVNGFKVDFWFAEIGLVVETDGLRYHRTPAQQARDRLRDQAHTAAGLTCLRFTHAQVRFEPAHVQATLRAVADRLRDR